MTYSVSRREPVREELFLKDEQGNIVKTLSVRVDADKVAKCVSREHLNLIHAYERVRRLQESMEESVDGEGAARENMAGEAAIQKRTSGECAVQESMAGENVQNADQGGPDDGEIREALEEAGRAAYALYETLLGEENARTVLEFYGDRLIEMNLEITPFLTQVMIPKIREAVNERKREAALRYGMEKKAAKKHGAGKGAVRRRTGDEYAKGNPGAEKYDAKKHAAERRPASPGDR